MDLAENILESEAAKNIWAPEKHESSGFYECEKNKHLEIQGILCNFSSIRNKK